MYVQRGALREALGADLASVRTFAGVRALMDVQVRLPAECGRTLIALERSAADYTRGVLIDFATRVRVTDDAASCFRFTRFNCCCGSKAT